MSREDMEAIRNSFPLLALRWCYMEKAPEPQSMEGSAPRAADLRLLASSAAKKKHFYAFFFYYFFIADIN